jgi:hypothetical protein
LPLSRPLFACLRHALGARSREVGWHFSLGPKAPGSVAVSAGQCGVAVRMPALGALLSAWFVHAFEERTQGQAAFLLRSMVCILAVLAPPVRATRRRARGALDEHGEGFLPVHKGVEVDSLPGHAIEAIHYVFE